MTDTTRLLVFIVLGLFRACGEAPPPSAEAEPPSHHEAVTHAHAGARHGH